MKCGYLLLACFLMAVAVFKDADAQNFPLVTHYIIRQAYMANMRAYPFTVGGYNDEVVKNYPDGRGENMTLPFNPDAIAYIYIFDYNVIPWNESAVIMQSLADAASQRFQMLSQRYYPANDINNVTNLPYIHTQTAGNAAGGAFYYQESQVENPPSYWKGKTIYGSSVNPNYRLSTGFAGAIVFSTLRAPSFVPPKPFDVYKTQEEKIMLLNYNYMLFFNKCPFDD